MLIILTIAAAQNHEKATLVLGLFYEYSQNNYEEARKYYSILAEKKNIEGFRHHGLVEMKFGEKENGVLHLKEACEADDVVACEKLGKIKPT